MRSELTTDLSKIRSNLNSIESNCENVVLIKTGALNPIHRSHISNLIKTKQHLEKVYHLNVIGEFLLPTHDQYVKGKLGSECLPGQLRIELCQKAIEEENQEDLTLSLQNFIDKHLKLDKPIRVIYVAGLDLFNRCRGMHTLRGFSMGGVAVIYQPGESQLFIQSIIKENSSKLYFVSINDNDQDQFNDISSTLIRKKLQNNEDCSHLTYKSVLQCLQTPTMDDE